MPLPLPSPLSPAEAAGHLWGRMGQSFILWGTFLTLPAFLKFLPPSADFYPRALRGCLHPCSTHPGERPWYEFSEAPPHRQCLHPVGVGTPRPASTETRMDDAQGGAPGIRVSLAGRPGPSTLDVSHYPSKEHRSRRQTSWNGCGWGQTMDKADLGDGGEWSRREGMESWGWGGQLHDSDNFAGSARS